LAGRIVTGAPHISCHTLFQAANSENRFAFDWDEGARHVPKRADPHIIAAFDRFLPQATENNPAAGGGTNLALNRRGDALCPYLRATPYFPAPSPAYVVCCSHGG
jgi:hypothetical protein